MRQLAAIVFADMVGYTALMQVNETSARQKRARYKAALEASVVAYNGKILQHYGDGSLSIFNSAIDAVGCAVAIQQELLRDPSVDLRMGIHIGDITVEDGAIYGDGVNLASRIESLAIPGSVLISEKVFDEVRNQEGINTRELGYFEFKNVLQPMRVFAISNKGLIVPSRSALQGKTREPLNRLAVLPFVNMSADPENEYFSDGITEEILNALTKVEGLQVTSRTSVFAFKGKQSDIRDIAIQLNVDKVLEGSVRRSGNRVRITAQLINAMDGYHIWSENYDRNLTDIFEVQDEISNIIANRLRENMLPQQRAPLVRQSVTNVEAYTHYLKGLHFWNKLTPADRRRAITSFEKAIDIEPTYALAYAMTAMAYSALGSSGQMIPAVAFKAVHHFADKALELDNEIAEGHVAKAAAYLLYEWKWHAAFESLQKARQLNPGGTTGSDLLSTYYIIMDDKDNALKTMEEAVERDPLSTIMSHTLGNVYVFTERYDDAIRQADKILEINPTMRSSIDMKGWAIGMKGDWQTALTFFEEVHRLTGHPLKGLMGLGFAYAKLGERDKAMECIRKLEQRQIEDPDTVIDSDLVAIWYALGDFDKTFYHIRQCMDKRLAPILYFIRYPIFKALRDDARYEELVEEIRREL